MTEFVKFELPSGIKCVHRQVKSPVAYCGLTIGAGSRDENDSEHGLAHLTEHSIFKGTKKRRAFHINNRLENLGGDLNAFTTKEETVIHATTLRKDFRRAAELISDIAFNSTFPEKEVNKEKEIILDEINSYKDAPFDRIFDDFEDLLFNGSSLGHNILGNKRAITKYTPDDIRRFVSRAYNTDKMVFSSVGRMSHREFRKACEQYFGDIAPNIRKFGRQAVPDAVPFNITLNKNTFQSHCILGTRAYSAMDKKRIPLALLINMLGGASANSILNTSVREKNGLSYNIEAGYSPLSDTGIATIYFSCDKENLDHCLEIINGELGKITSGGITPRQLSIAKKQFIGQLYISMESNEGYMLGAGKSILTYDGIDTVESIAQRIHQVNISEITDVANEIFGGNLSSLTYR